MKSRFSLTIVLFLLLLDTSVKAQNKGIIKLSSATDNRQFTLNKEKGKFVALHFLLKTECPYCIKHTQEYFSKAKEYPKILQVFIKPDTEMEIKAWAKKLNPEDLAKFPIYHDPDAKLAKQFNIPNGYKFHNQIIHYPATVLIGPNGKEVYRYVGKNNTDRLSIYQLADKVKELSRK